MICQNMNKLLLHLTLINSTSTNSVLLICLLVYFTSFLELFFTAASLLQTYITVSHVFGIFLWFLESAEFPIRADIPPLPFLEKNEAFSQSIISWSIMLYPDSDDYGV